MEYIPFNAKTIVTPDIANRLPLEAAFNNWAEETEPPSIVPGRFNHDMNAHDRDFPLVYVEPMEEYFELDQKYPAWKVVTAWTGGAVVSWALVIGCVMIVRALLP
ncbi:MAG: hypothetical protein ABSF45_11275 [Terriglobia bacterium]|jgi:hypothetical protein